MSYKISKSNFVWQKKFEENKKNIETQLQGVSKAISSIAENIEKNIKNEEQYSNEKKQVIELLKQNHIWMIMEFYVLQLMITNIRC